MCIIQWLKKKSKPNAKPILVLNPNHWLIGDPKKNTN